MTPRLATLVGVISIAAGVILLPWLQWPPVVGYAVLFIGTSALFLLIAPAVLRASLPGHELAMLLALLFLVRATFLFTTPIGSDDFHRYVWDGRLQAAGLSPYLHAPNAPELQPLHTETLPRLVNNPSLKTPYFPLAEWVFRLAYRLSGEAIWGIRLLVLLAEALAVGGTVLLLRHLGKPGTHALLYAAAPLAIFQFAIDAHVDAVGFPFLVLGLLAWLRGWKTGGLVLLGLSMSIKPVAAVILPFLFLAGRGWRERLAVLLVPALTVGVQFVPYLDDPGLFDGLFRFAQSWRFNGSVFNVLRYFLRDTPLTRALCGLLLALALALLAWRSGRGATRAAATGAPTLASSSVYAVLLLILCAPVVHPWYVGWLAVLLPMAPCASGLALVGTVSLTSLTFVTYQLEGLWVDYTLVRLVEYVPVFVLLAREVVTEART